ncbi:MAG: xylulokinase [Kiritimatiellia bacterium]
MRNLHLGFDSSTQSLSVVVIDLDQREVVYQNSLDYHTSLPQFDADHGVLRDEDPTVVHASPLMWLEALDILFKRMLTDGVPLHEVCCISGSGQQHGSVYLNGTAPDVLATLDPERTLVENLASVLSRSTAPIWMDSSTTRQCEEITHAMDAHGGIIEATGSAAFERFTGPQIRKFWQEEPDAYANTRHIALVSSFMCSVLTGKIAPVDPGDGAGMNLMDIRQLDWHPAALEATAPGLAEKLPPVAPAASIAGKISPYFVKRYGLNPDALSVIWSGDNPCSVVGLGLIQPGMVAISMGTSFTYFGTMAECHVDRKGEGHVFGSPAGGYMTLNCFKNGGLARARIRDQFALDWDGYRAAMAETPPGNQGRLMLPWYEPEIVPKVVKPGVRRLNLNEDDRAGNCRALVEGQILAMRLHAGWMETTPSMIYATGGVSQDPSVLQVIADVFQCPVGRSMTTNSAALGAALVAARAFHANLAWPEITRGFTEPAGALFEPGADTKLIYDDLLLQYADFERKALSELS